MNDEDGCPELGQDLWCQEQGINSLLDGTMGGGTDGGTNGDGITVSGGLTSDTIIVKSTECNQCPCQFWDFASDLTNNDEVRAILRDKKKTTQYKFSLPWIVDF
jgi:hypothetical protein